MNRKVVRGNRYCRPVSEHIRSRCPSSGERAGGIIISASASADCRVPRYVQRLQVDRALRAPNIEQIETLLKDEGIPLHGPQVAQKAVATFRQKWAERNPTTPNPEKLRALLENERQGKPGPMVAEAAVPQIMSLAVPVEFPKSDTFDWCGAPVTTVGPLHNQIPAPGPRDNNTIWYQDTTPALYDELYFGVGPNAGVIVQHPNLGTVDLRGNTMGNYYLEQSGGTFVPKGEVYPKWLQAAHSEGWYGADGESWNADHTECQAGDNHNVRAADLVREVVDGINADNPSFAWETYDGDGDGFVDNFTVLHAGMGQEAGGGSQGDFAIWSHASAIDYPTGKLACTAGSTGCPERNIYVRSYSMDPENIDIGVISEEFGHAAFGLPDIYTTDYQASPSNWTIMESGSWNGILGGMQPAPFSLFFRYLVGWAKPVELDYTTGPVIEKVGQLRSLPWPRYCRAVPLASRPRTASRGSRSTCRTRWSRPITWQGRERPGGPTGPTWRTSTWPTTST